jgi:hypothetical protein
MTFNCGALPVKWKPLPHSQRVRSGEGLTGQLLVGILGLGSDVFFILQPRRFVRDSSARRTQDVDQVPPLLLPQDLFQSGHRVGASAKDREEVAVGPILQGVGLGEVGSVLRQLVGIRATAPFPSAVSPWHMAHWKKKILLRRTTEASVNLRGFGRALSSAPVL